MKQGLVGSWAGDSSFGDEWQLQRGQTPVSQGHAGFRATRFLIPLSVSVGCSAGQGKLQETLEQPPAPEETYRRDFLQGHGVAGQGVTVLH